MFSSVFHGIHNILFDSKVIVFVHGSAPVLPRFFAEEYTENEIYELYRVRFVRLVEIYSLLLLCKCMLSLFCGPYHIVQSLFQLCHTKVDCKLR